jgi:hypothetical protein
MKNTIVIAAFALLAFVTPAITKAQDGVACTMQYQPVCGTENGTYKTYGNGCTLGASDAVYQHEGECTAAELKGTQEGPYVPPAHCTAWSDGCNSCSRGANGQAACTLMACLDAPRAGYCKVYQETEVEDQAQPPVAATPSSEVSADVANYINNTPAFSGTTTAVASTGEEEPGFFARVWISISGWFSNLF